MEAIILHDKFTEEAIGTVLLKVGTTFEQITTAWDKYQETNNSNSQSDDEPDIYGFVAKGNWELCEVLDVEFYQP